MLKEFKHLLLMVILTAFTACTVIYINKSDRNKIEVKTDIKLDSLRVASPEHNKLKEKS